MGISQSRYESIINGGLVQLTAMSKWRRAYRLLYDNCCLTHHEIRAIFKEHLGGLAYHKNLLHTEYNKDKQRWQNEANTLALLVNKPDVDEFLSALNSVVEVGNVCCHIHL